MAIQVKMFVSWVVVLFIFNTCDFFVRGDLTNQENQKVIEDVLKHLNEENNTQYRYESAKVIEAHKVNENTYLLLDVATTCQEAATKDTSCEPISLVCQGANEQGSLSVVKCFLKEDFPELPNYSQGFISKRSNNFIEEILEHGLGKLERDGGPKRKTIEILSVKKRETSNTEVFITSKVTAGSEEGGDLLELEICELAAVLGTPGSMQILDTETKCFPLLEESHDTHLGGTPVTSDQLSTLAHWALAKINHGTNLVFNYSLIEVIKADAVATPGSGGVLTTLQVRLAPSKCPKYSAVSQVEWDCESTGQPLICTLSAWERPWRGDTLMSRPRCKRLPLHTGNSQRAVGSNDPITPTKGFCTGCLEELNKENPQVTELATSALEQLNAGQLSATPHQLLRVISAHRQVVNGIRYVLNVELAPCSAEMVPCQIAADAEGGLLCRLELLEDSIDLQRRLLSSLCQPKNQADQISETDVQPASEVPTEQPDIATSTPETEDKGEMLADAPANSSEEISSEEKVETNKKENSSEENNSSEEQGQKEEEQHIEYAGPHSTTRRAKRSNGLLGGPEDVDMEKEGELIKSLAQTAVQNMDDIDDDASRRKLIAVVGAKKQVVNGILYHLSLRVGVMPPCDNGEENCMDGELPTLLCKVQVHRAAADLKTGQAATRVMRSNCEPEGSVEIQEVPTRPDTTSTQQTSTNDASRQKRAVVVGGKHPADLNDPYVREIAQFSLVELDRMSNALYKRQVVRIVSAEKQVVAGIMNHLTLELGYSSCRKGSSPNEVCSLQSNEDREMCTVSVWDRPWLKERKVQNFTCTRVPASTNRAKRDTNLLGHGSHDIHIGLFRDFMSKHGKQYSSNEEFRKRFHIFRANMRKVKVLQETEQGTGQYGATQFSDLTAEEFKSQYLGLNRDLQGKGKMRMNTAIIPDIQLPPEFDWRHYNVVTPVKNQGSCGSCWAFSVTGNVEGQWALRRGTLLSLSEQELVDCDKLDSGCNGGLPSNAYEAIQKIGGLETEDDYPYEGRGENCHFNKTEVKATVTGGLNITTNETAIAQWLVKNGPISIGINANAMQFYYGGVSHPWKLLCDPANLDHGVLIVGYGVHTTSIRHKKMPYWIVKNSWGRSWGEQGYYRVYRGDGTCGVNQMATSAIIG